MAHNETGDGRRPASLDAPDGTGLPPIGLVALIVGLLLAILATFL